MAKLRPFDVVNLLARNDGEEARLIIRNKMGNPSRIPVRLSDVQMDTGTDGTEVTIRCQAIFDDDPMEDVRIQDTYSSAMIDWNKLAKQRLNEICGSGAFHRESPINKEDLEATYNLTHRKIAINTYPLTIKNVIHSAPATIVFWMDGTKTVVKAVNEEYDPEKGIAMAFVKKMFGNKGNYFNNIKKWLPKQEAKVEEDASTGHTEATVGCSDANYLQHLLYDNPCLFCAFSANCPFGGDSKVRIPESKYDEWLAKQTKAKA